MEGTRGARRVCVGKPGNRDYLEDVGLDGKIILKCIGWGACTNLICLRIWTGGGLL
jgi:hypothetical protein